MIARLSDQNIVDDIIRASFYSDLLSYTQSPNADVILYSIKTDEEFRPDLLSFRAFGTQDLDWLVLLVAGIDDVSIGIPVGEIIKLPQSSFVRQTMRKYIS